MPSQAWKLYCLEYGQQHVCHGIHRLAQLGASKVARKRSKSWAAGLLLKDGGGPVVDIRLHEYRRLARVGLRADGQA